MRDKEKSIAELLELGDMGLELGYWRQAEGYFDLVLERAPGHPRALLGKAKACQDPVEALDLVRQVLSVRPANHEARELQKELEERVETSDADSSDIIRLPGPDKGEGKEKAPSSPLEREMSQYTTPSLSPESTAYEDLSLSEVTSESMKEDPELGFGQRIGRIVKRLFAAGMDKKTRRKLIAGYVIANLLVGGLIVAMLYPRLLPLLDEQAAIDALQHLSDDNRAAVEVAFPSQTAGPNLLRQAERATALIIVPDPIFQDVSRGSGCIISPEGLAITNHHVMTKEAGGTLGNKEGLAFVGLTKDVHESPSVWYIGCLVASDTRRDLAILQILWNSEGKRVGGLSFPHMPLGDSDELELGQTLMGLGYPSLGGNTLTLTRGSMAGFSSSQSDLHLGKTDSELLPGSSGGAVLDETGRLVGVITAAHTDQRTQGRLSYFVLLNEAKEVIREAQAAPRPDPQIDWMVDISDELLE